MEREPWDNFNRQLENCNFIKIVLMLLVVAGHCTSLWTASGWFNQTPEKESIVLGLFAGWVGSFHIYAFVLVSGYIFAYLKFGCRKYKKFLPFVRQKAKRLLVPFAFSAILWVAPWHWYFFRCDGIEMVRKYVLAITPSQLWFLWMLFLVFVIVFWISDILYQKMWIGLGISLGFYALSLVGKLVNIPNIFQMWTACQYVFFFSIGIILWKNGLLWVKKIPIAFWVICDVALFFASKSCSSGTSLLFRMIRMGLGLCLHAEGAIMAFLLLDYIASKLHYKGNVIYEFFKKQNFTIYLFHQQVIYWIVDWLNGKASPWIIAAISFVAAIAVPSAIAVVLNRWKITRILIGQKG